jgi:calcineurin-like phosphoesterase family protein
MLKHTKFNTKNRRLFVTSDPHFSHNKDFVYQKRGFSSVEEHDETLISRWNSKITNNDDVLVIGDFMLNASKEKCAHYFRRLNGFIYYLWGNHESFTSKLYFDELNRQFGRTDIEIYPLVWEGKVSFCGSYMSGFINKTPFVAFHFPMRIWDYQNHGAIHFSGHSHASDQESLANYLECKRLDVGVDSFGAPMLFEDLMVIFDKKGVSKLDHH